MGSNLDLFASSERAGCSTNCARIIGPTIADQPPIAARSGPYCDWRLSRMKPTRQAAIGTGLPFCVPTMSANRVCGSGAQASPLPTTATILRLPAGWKTGPRALSVRGRPSGSMGPAQVLYSRLPDRLMISSSSMQVILRFPWSSPHVRGQRELPRTSGSETAKPRRGRGRHKPRGRLVDEDPTRETASFCWVQRQSAYAVPSLLASMHAPAPRAHLLSQWHPTKSATAA